MKTADTISLWDGTAAEPDYRNPVDGEATADVAIVGGGYTGLSTALHCAEQGLAAHVLEARHIGFGGSGRNVGLVNAGVWHPPAAVRKALGDPYGARFIRRFAEAPGRVFDLIEKHQIRCEATRCGTIHVADAPSGMRDLQRRHAEWQRLGQPVDLLTRDAVSHKTGSHAFHGGLLDHRAGTINPMGYCRGLARAAIAAGAAINTGAAALGLYREGPIWRVETQAGNLRAKTVILATNAYSDTLWPGLDRAFTMIPFFQLASRPLPAAMAHILPGRQGIWSTGKIMFSLRRDAYDRLIIGSMGAVSGSVGRGLSLRWAQKTLARLYPGLGPVTFEQAWHGQIAMTPDHLPRILTLAPGLYAPVGYNGRGITTGTIFGECLASLLTGADPTGLPLPLTDLVRVRGAPVMSRLYQTAFLANQFLRSL